MMVRTGAGCAMLAAGVVATGGCASERTAHLLVTVSDAQTHRPLAGAKVQADTCSRNHPFSVASMLGQTGPLTSVAYSDEEGRARVEMLDGWPVRIGVLIQGFPLTLGVIDEPWTGPATFFSNQAEEANGLEVRVETERAATEAAH